MSKETAENIALAIAEDFGEVVPMIVMNNPGLSFDPNMMETVFLILTDYYCMVYGVSPDFVQTVLTNTCNLLLDMIPVEFKSAPADATIN